ncbi:MAG: hypothetical protein IJU37_03955 [Desulfovibrio sp.]|nr:hypothetical protein [Desulfovibrio sp.]
MKVGNESLLLNVDGLSSNCEYRQPSAEDKRLFELALSKDDIDASEGSQPVSTSKERQFDFTKGQQSIEGWDTENKSTTAEAGQQSVESPVENRRFGHGEESARIAENHQPTVADGGQRLTESVVNKATAVGQQSAESPVESRRFGHGEENARIAESHQPTVAAGGQRLTESVANRVAEAGQPSAVSPDGEESVAKKAIYATERQQASAPHKDEKQHKGRQDSTLHAEGLHRDQIMPSAASLIESLFPQYKTEGASVPTTEAAPMLHEENTMDKLVERILVAEKSSGTQEVRITLADGLLNGAELTIQRHLDGQLAVLVSCMDDASFQTAVSARQGLTEALKAHGESVQVVVSKADAGGGNEGDTRQRSRGLQFESEEASQA